VKRVGEFEAVLSCLLDLALSQVNAVDSWATGRGEVMHPSLVDLEMYIYIYKYIYAQYI
jgi:hypothetical protein